ncbi:unnamed protein product [Brassica napus]|nr:unnamed protein product [Brassica napus]
MLTTYQHAGPSPMDCPTTDAPCHYQIFRGLSVLFRDAPYQHADHTYQHAGPSPRSDVASTKTDLANDHVPLGAGSY